MSFSDFLKEKDIDTNNREIVELLQIFYQEGYMQGVHDKSPNYEYSLKYKKVVERVLSLFSRTLNPIGLDNLEKDLEYYLNDRRERENYLDMLPKIKLAYKYFKTKAYEREDYFREHFMDD